MTEGERVHGNYGTVGQDSDRGVDRHSVGAYHIACGVMINDMGKLVAVTGRECNLPALRHLRYRAKTCKGRTAPLLIPAGKMLVGQRGRYRRLIQRLPRF